jgi:hypothetical protein
MLAWAGQNGAKSVRILRPEQVHSLRMPLPEGLDPEELHTAIAYEAAGEIGAEPEAIRLSAVRAQRLRLGADSDTLLLAGHEASLVERYAQDCAQAGLRFGGVGCLELAALARHARESPGERLLLLRRQGGFLAVPAGDQSEPLMRSVAFGCQRMADPDREAELLEQSRRSFTLLGHTPIHVVSVEPLGEACVRRLRQAVGQDVALRIETLEDFAPGMLSHVAWAKPGGADQGSALVSVPPRPKDPHRGGTWAALAVVLITVAGLGGLWHSANQRLERANQRQADWEVLTTARDTAQKQYDALIKQRNDLMQVRSVLQKTRPLCPGLPPLLEALPEAIPPYTRVTLIEQAGPEIRFEGRAVWPRGASLLAQAMGRDMQPHGYQLEPGKLSQDDDEEERAFSYRLIPMEDARR